VNIACDRSLLWLGGFTGQIEYCGIICVHLDYFLAVKLGEFLRTDRPQILKPLVSVVPGNGTMARIRPPGLNFSLENEV